MTIRRPTKPAAERAGLSPSLFEKLRMRGEGPAFLKIGKKVLYDDADVDRWLTTRRVEPNKDRAA